MADCYKLYIYTCFSVQYKYSICVVNTGNVRYYYCAFCNLETDQGRQGHVYRSRSGVRGVLTIGVLNYGLYMIFC